MFSCLFLCGIAQLSRNTLQSGVSHRCACVKLSSKGGIAPFWGTTKLPQKVSRDMGYYRSDSIAISRDMEPLSLQGDRAIATLVLFISCATVALQKGPVNLNFQTLPEDPNLLK